MTPRTAACQASLPFTISWSLLKLMSAELVMPPNHLILCHLRTLVQMGKLRPKRPGEGLGLRVHLCLSSVLSPHQRCLLLGSFLTPDLALEAVSDCHMITGCTLRAFHSQQRAAKRSLGRREETVCGAPHAWG